MRAWEQAIETNGAQILKASQEKKYENIFYKQFTLLKKKNNLMYKGYKKD